MKIFAPKALLLTIVLMFGALGCGAVALTSWTDHRESLEETVAITSDLVRLLEEHTKRTFDAAALIVHLLRSRAEEGGIAAVAQSPAEVRRIRKAVDMMPQVHSVHLFDAEGRMLLSTGGGDASIHAARGYVEIHRQGTEVAIGPALTMSAAGEHNFAYSLRLDNNRGEMIGAAAAMIEADYFKYFYTGLRLGPGTAFTIFSEDGSVIARYPEPASVQPGMASGSELFSSLLRRSPAGTYRGPAVVGDEERVISYRKVEGLPLIVTASVRSDQALAPWYSRLYRNIAFLAAALAALALLTLAALRSFQREEVAKSELRRTLDGLEQRVRERTEALEKALAEQTAAECERAFLAKQMAHQTHRFDAILSAMTDMVFLFGADLRCQFANPAAAALMERPREDWLGKTWRDMGVLPAMRDPVEAHVMDVFRTGTSVTAEAALDRNGMWHHYEYKLSPIRNADGDIASVLAVTREVTRRKMIEDALRRAKEEAERANISKSKFLAAASHDLRQPVQALFFFADVLSRKLEGPSLQLVSHLERSLDALSMLLESLLDISKLDAGIITPSTVDFPVAALLDHLATEFTPAAAEKGLELRVVRSSAAIRSDPALLSRLVRNLLLNAVRYTESGRILLGCRRRGGIVAIEVWDTGIGIPSDRLDEIFEEFIQLGNPERDRTKGLGLGLAIVQRLAQLMGHRVTVHSRPGSGSVFSVEVPMAGGEDETLIAPFPRTAKGKPMVLLIDDEPPILAGLSLIFQDWGFEVVSAASATEAMEMLDHMHRPPDAIVADYRLRDGRTGAEAIRNIQNLFRQPIPSIIITGETGTERLRDIETGGVPVLHKPIEAPQLHAFLERQAGG